MMAMAKIAVLLLVVLTATALENSHEIDSTRDFLHYSSPALSPSADVEEHNKASLFCELKCELKCHFKKASLKWSCLSQCLTHCNKSSYSFSKSSCVDDCVESSTNNLRYDANMMDDRISACSHQCKKD